MAELYTCQMCDVRIASQKQVGIQSAAIYCFFKHETLSLLLSAGWSIAIQ